MTLEKTLGQGLATGVQLALVAIISIALSTTTKDSAANTLSSLKTSAPVAPLSAEDVAARSTARLDRAMNALSQKDAALYRALFDAQGKEEWGKADTLIRRITDKRLMGPVLADRYTRRGGSAQELSSWLKAYTALPEAADIYALAVKAGGKNLPRPNVPGTWSGGGEIDSAANFSPELAIRPTAPNSSTQKLARAIQKALRRNKPEVARNLLINAQNDKELAGTFAADAEAVIAAAFFRAGEREQATALSGAAAGANQPLGLWIRGLIAWEKRDYEAARKLFTRLSDHPALSESNKSAASFWAYRSEAKAGHPRQAHKHLVQAADAPRTFYGLLAGQLLGQSPIATLGQKTEAPVWGAQHRSILAGSPAGWRAMALIQVGQNAKAEAELRRLNPQGSQSKRQAMQALAAYVPMPALALQLAHLVPSRSLDPAFYPLPPWKPAGGFKVDRALLFALARHESLFDPSAVSVRGARGLMQIMPATAAYVMRNASTPLDETDLLDPAFSMTLGQKYVRELMDAPGIGNNLLLLLAAYNGGPTKALTWSAGKKSDDPLLFMESIPVRETRNYVARVLPHYWAYSARLGKPTPSLRQMAEGHWPTIPLAEKAPVHIADAGLR